VIEVEVLEDPAAVSISAAAVVARTARERIDTTGRMTLAVSGGRSPWSMFASLSTLGVDWQRFAIFQVDERIAPDGDPDRNLTRLLASLPAEAAADVHPMPVTADDLDVAAAGYASSLPARFDLIHLGLGPDGHTASLVPGDPVLEIADRDVAVTAEYQGHRRMTLTFPVLDRASIVLWLVTGGDKADALKRLLERDPSIPAGRVRAERQLVFCDRAAASG
jgi:6-phosphogluconolactonase